MASRGIFDATVVANVSLCREHYKLTLHIPGLPESAPGQFVQVNCRNPHAGEVDHEVEWAPGQRPTIVGAEFDHHEAFLRRPFSIAGRRGDDIDLIGREVGPGTRFLAHLKAGDAVSVVGPLGNRFELPGPNGIALLVGGGVGIPPMIYVAQAIEALNAANPNDRPRRAVAFAGALTKDLMALTVTDDHAPSPLHQTTEPQNHSTVHPVYNVAEFRAFNVPAILTTDDGTLGMKGFVTVALEQYLDAYLTDNADRNRAILYTCGPEGMMKAIQQIAARRGIRCQIAVERAMACGMGTCQSCCIKVKKPDPSKPPLEGKDWCYRLACTDGPVFEGTTLLW
ncbi:MAG: dihydroorotate dehydrogenase electron transfer subunit [Tepidisphaeraceae bacterium]